LISNNQEGDAMKSLGTFTTVAALATSLALPADAAARSRAAGSDRGEHYAIGHVAEAAKDHLVIERESDGMIRLKVSRGTNVMIEGRKASADQLRPGAPVFAAFEGNGKDVTASAVRADRPRTSDGSTQSSHATGSAK
jgi:hypothetical protein